jgi:hypothetical protein
MRILGNHLKESAELYYEQDPPGVMETITR